MTCLLLPSYKTLIANEIFEREATPLRSANDEELPATEIIRLAKCTFPSLEGVVAHIQTEAGKLVAAEIANRPSAEPKSLEREASATQIILQQYFSPENWATIVQRAENTLHDIRASYNIGVLQLEKAYVEVLGVLAPNISLNFVEKNLQKWEVLVEESIRAAGIPYWHLVVRLQEDGSFPTAAELAYLTERGVRDSDVLTIRGGWYDYAIVSEELQCLAQALPSVEHLAAVRDISQLILDQRAAIALQRLVLSVTLRELVAQPTAIPFDPPEENIPLDIFEIKSVPPKERN